MASTIALIHAIVGRARPPLPFLAPASRDHLQMIAPLLAMGEPTCGIYGHQLCSDSEREALWRQRPQLRPPRQSLPGRVNIQSLIVIPEPAPASLSNCALTAVVLPTSAAEIAVITARLAEIAADFAESGVILNSFCGLEPPQRLIQAVLQRGVVVAGKHPVTTTDFDNDIAFYIGELPRLIGDATYVPRRDWDPYTAYLEECIAELIRQDSYPAGFSLNHVNPFLLPYLPLFEEAQSERLLKLRQALCGLLRGFGPCRAELERLSSDWQMADCGPNQPGASLRQGLRVRRQFVALDEQELPISQWPPPKSRARASLRLVRTKGLWHLEDFNEFSHRYAWVTLTWAALSGLIDGATTIRATEGLELRPDAARRLCTLRAAILAGLDLIIPADHTEGSIECRQGRFFFQGEAFAALRQGQKIVLELEQDIKRKAMLDDKGLDYLKG